MEIGAQQLANTFLAELDEIARLGRLFGVERPLSLPPPKPQHIMHGKLEHLEEKLLLQGTSGFGSVSTMLQSTLMEARIAYRSI